MVTFQTQGKGPWGTNWSFGYSHHKRAALGVCVPTRQGTVGPAGAGRDVKTRRRRPPSPGSRACKHKILSP